ncbi:MAG: tRNA epoxyqueuosine(34) reductase QueG [Anaerolineae bacterium]|nr:tRNA epoxyqueuosine(34) reductase QueG [Anaerolineae bacterium]
MGLADRIVLRAHELGFDLAGIAPADRLTGASRYAAWLAGGYHGQMAYLARPDAVAKRMDLSLLLPGVQSVAVVGANYHSVVPTPDHRADPSRGAIASYAWGDDYHDLFISRLQQLGAFIQAEAGQPVAYRAYADTGPILERELAAGAGLGFIGKNTNLIHPQLGSWLLLGELLLTLELPAAAAISTDAGRGQAVTSGSCGNCTRCLDNCPTGALVAPYTVDARRCISYLTIELKGPIPRQLRPLIGNRIFGCDICQEVCPWNRRFARPTAEAAFQPRPGLAAPLLLDLMALDDAGWRKLSGSPVTRARRRGLLRNVAVALGNWGDPAAVPALTNALRDPEPLVRGHAAWALGRIATAQACHSLKQASIVEGDEWVQEELKAAMLDLW